MKIDTIKHKKAKRAYIPSKEEAGSEEVNPKVKAKQKANFPKNPVIHRGQDPELFWMNKYGADDADDTLSADIRSLYRHEHIAPETLISALYSLKEAEGEKQMDLFSVPELFGNGLELDEIDKVSEYYKHQDDWTNRMIQGDSLLVMTSLLEREGLAGKIQTIYIDPPYGIKYGSNWQMKMNNRNVTDGKDDHLSGEPEQIKAYRDTWELGIHSYLSYLRDRLLVAKELLTGSGSCFVQISDENVHLVRCLMDEVFGSGNFVSLIIFTKTTGLGKSKLDKVNDFVIWYGKNDEQLKYRQLFLEKKPGMSGASRYTDKDKTGKLYTTTDLRSQSGNKKSQFIYEFEGKKFSPSPIYWKTNFQGFENLKKKKRLIVEGKTLRYKRYLEDFIVNPVNNLWSDVGGIQDRIEGKLYVVQTTIKVIQRCLLMTTDPGDLVLDPTCGSGTTAYVAEQWGRRWIAIDTSRIALNISKTRLMTATYPYYLLHDEKNKDIRQGFVYKKVPHITLKALANDEPSKEETLYDQPKADKKRLRVSGPFTVETLQSFEPILPETLDEEIPESQHIESFEQRIFEHLISAGIKTGVKEEKAVFVRVERISSAYLHAEGFYNTDAGEKKAYLHIGPKFGTVSKQAVNESVKECRARGDADWLIILGFSFESNIASETVTTNLGSFKATKARMHDDLLQEGLLKKDKKAASFVTIGEPDIKVRRNGSQIQVEILGLDIYDPIKDMVKPRNVSDIAYWMVDDDYDGSNFVARQVFFCGGAKKEFQKWQKGLDNLAMTTAKRNAEKTLRIEVDDEAFARVYGHISHPIDIRQKSQKIAVRVVSQFGEESTKVSV
ncbi:DNA methyltransferase [Desulfococcaceae bacterium HSG8]|nr:DNA methyltransferase [Desulfococcaceae bacterium HSG8]